MQTPSNHPSLTPRATIRETPATSTLSTSTTSSQGNRKPRYEAPLSPRKSVTSSIRMPFEPEDAYITGATRSLSRRLLALNLRQAC
jgi:hypothetical protein